jgi:hypothetical protein
MSYTLILYELRYVHSPIVPGLTPLTTAPGGFSHVLVALNKFTKWIEYKPITTLFQCWRYGSLMNPDETGLHKLNSRWEGPFIMHKVIGPGSYRLQYPDGQEVPNSWNIEHLCCFHP